jgi:hypothetical protein
MMVHAFQGNQRGGKGIGCTTIAIKYALRAFLKYGKWPRIYANYHLFKYPYFTYFFEWKDIKHVKNAIICYDEIGGSQDARLFNSKSQILFTNVFNQMGKMGNVFLYTCQREFQVEKRVREQTDYVIECSKNHATGVLTQVWYDVQRGREPQNKKLIGRHNVKNASRIYSHYDTFEVVESTAKFDDVHARN